MLTQPPAQGGWVPWQTFVGNFSALLISNIIDLLTPLFMSQREMQSDQQLTKIQGPSVLKQWSDYRKWNTCNEWKYQKEKRERKEWKKSGES